MANTKWKENNTLRLREFVPENTIKEDVLLEDDYFRFYIISGRKFDNYGGMDYGKGEYKVDSKGKAQDFGIYISVGQKGYNSTVSINILPRKDYSYVMRPIKSPKEFIDVFQKAIEFSKKIAKKINYTFKE